jgi:hypothetical protein
MENFHKCLLYLSKFINEISSIFGNSSKVSEKNKYYSRFLLRLYSTINCCACKNLSQLKLVLTQTLSICLFLSLSHIPSISQPNLTLLIHSFSFTHFLSFSLSLPPSFSLLILHTNNHTNTHTHTTTSLYPCFSCALAFTQTPTPTHACTIKQFLLVDPLLRL